MHEPVMRAARLPLVLCLCFATAACGAASPRAVAEPRKGEDPLFKGPLDTDAEITHAIREFYTKYEYRIPMRDGAKLYTVVYVPKDARYTYPIMLQRTPYSVAPYGIDNYPDS